METESTTPSSPSVIISAEPPYENSGSDIPVFGMVFVTTAMLSSTCIPIWVTQPAASSEPKRSGQFIAIT